jgi:hypothetical protein
MKKLLASLIVTCSLGGAVLPASAVSVLNDRVSTYRLVENSIDGSENVVSFSVAVTPLIPLAKWRAKVLPTKAKAATAKFERWLFDCDDWMATIHKVDFYNKTSLVYSVDLDYDWKEVVNGSILDVFGTSICSEVPAAAPPITSAPPVTVPQTQPPTITTAAPTTLRPTTPPVTTPTLPTVGQSRSNGLVTVTLFGFDPYPPPKSLVILDTGTRVVSADIQVCAIKAYTVFGDNEVEILDQQNRAFKSDYDANRSTTLNPLLDFVKLAPGECRRGWVTVAIPNTSPLPLRVRWSALFSDTAAITWAV